MQRMDRVAFAKTLVVKEIRQFDQADRLSGFETLP
jgi:hypothetical protein